MTVHTTDDNIVVTLTTDLTQLFKAVVSLEAIQDERSYTTLELMEAIDLIRDVLAGRLEEGFDDWKDDAKYGYETFFDSVKQQTRMTLTGHFTLPGKKLPRFVDVFNTLVLDRLYKLFVELGPEATCNMLGPILNMFSDIIQSDELDPMSIQGAKATLAGFRQRTRKLTSAERLSLIRRVCQKIRDVEEEDTREVKVEDLKIGNAQEDVE